MSYPKSPGVYAVVNKKSECFYIGHTTSLFRRHQEWRLTLSMGSYQKSHRLNEALKGTTPDDWEFRVIRECVTVTEAKALEVVVISGAQRHCLDKLLNKVHVTMIREDSLDRFAPKTRILADDGSLIPYVEARAVLGCTSNTLAKRLAKRRQRGQTEVYLSTLLKLTRRAASVRNNVEIPIQDTEPMAVRTRVPPRKAAVPRSARPASRRVKKAAPLPTRSAQTPKQIELTGTTPLPVRITAEQQAMLVKKRDKTGVPIQELVRRAIDHMLATTDIGAVPARR